MAKNKTQPTAVSVQSYLDTIESKERRDDCEALVSLMSKATKEPPKMWGSSIVGFGSLHYKYESGREGDTCLVGFSARKSEIALYGLRSYSGSEKLAANLGKHKWGKGCLYLSRLSEVNQRSLVQLVTGAFAERSSADT